MIDFALSGGLVAITLRNEAESPCFQKYGLALRLTSLPERFPPQPITPRKRRRTTCQTGNLHDNLLTGHELKQTYLAIPETAEGLSTGFTDVRRSFYMSLSVASVSAVDVSANSASSARDHEKFGYFDF
jgi:hypothetical protein